MNNPQKRSTLQKERSFDSSNGRPTKYFKLDRTYSDVVEDELYDPQPEPSEVSAPSVVDAPEPRTKRIQNVYPQLFTRPSVETNDRREVSSVRSDQYWPGMESGIRFERNNPGDRAESVIADRKQKLKQQPEQSTVSPKEAFLDYPDNADFDLKGSVFDRTSARQNLQSEQDQLSARSLDSPASGRPITLLPQATSQFTSEITAPKTITPVRAHEKLSPKPVSSSIQGTPISNITADSAGPSRAQAHNNAAANAKIRALYKEESTVSNTSIGSEPYTPPSLVASESEPSPSHPQMHSSDSPEAFFECVECHETFARASALELHLRVHARPPLGPPPASTEIRHDDDSYDDQDEEDLEEFGSRSSGRNKHKAGGPHRCDWVIPATGQICGTVFSRPYDLVRHQDTIHRAKKLEFKCDICIAAGTNKVFSRNDALVRHMRHVHKRPK